VAWDRRLATPASAGSRPVTLRQPVSWAEVEALCREAAAKLDGTQFDAVLGVARGGLVPTALIAQELDIRNVLVAAVAGYLGDRREPDLLFLEFPAAAAVRGRRILVVDDIWDTGRTVQAVRERLTREGAEVTVVVLHYKPARSAFRDLQPDYWCRETDAWILYPWERDT